MNESFYNILSMAFGQYKAFEELIYNRTKVLFMKSEIGKADIFNSCKSNLPYVLFVLKVLSSYILFLSQLVDGLLWTNDNMLHLNVQISLYSALKLDDCLDYSSIFLLQ